MKRKRVFILLAFVAVGIILLTLTHASPWSPNLETENATISSPVYRTQNTTASGGYAVKFSNLAPYQKACPAAGNVIQFDGDSNSTDNLGYPRFIDIPNYTEYIVARGGAAFTQDITYNGENVIEIGSQVRQYIETCGVPYAVVVEGSTNDYFIPRSASEIEAYVIGLSDYLKTKNTKVLWVAQQPVPKPSGQQDDWPQSRLDARNQYNAWLTNPGNVAGTVVDCTTALQDPYMSGGWLNPNYYRILDIFGNIDVKHMNDAGYQAMANCVKTKLQQIL